MSYLIFQPNLQKLIENQKKARATFAIDMYFQNQPNVLFLSKSSNTLQYFVIIQTKKLQKIQVVSQTHIRQNYVKLRFKPILLLSYNRQLSARSQRCIIQLNNKFQKPTGQNKNNFYKWYLNKSGYLNCQIVYSLEQFLTPMHTMIQIGDLLQNKIILMLPYLNIQNSAHICDNFKNQNQDEQEFTIFQRIKYMMLLNEVYKNHRHEVISKQSNSQKIRQKQQLLTSSLEIFSKQNKFIQEDTPFVQIIEKQRISYEIKLKQTMRLINPKIAQKKTHLSLTKLHSTQKQFQRYVKMIRKQNLDIYEITNTHYRIVRGIQNHVSKSQQKILSAQGSHSNIFFGTYSLHLSETLFTYSNDIKVEEGQKKAVVKPLICKRIKDTNFSSSVNSFKNQMDFLFYVKDKRSKFIASYFLPMNRTKYEACQLFAEFYEYNLKEYLEHKKNSNDIGLTLSQTIQFSQNILLALIFMVQNTILHRDLKPFNVMIDEKGKARVIDFGSCCSIMHKNDFEVTQKRMLTTPAYQIKYKQCPEEVRRKYTKQEYQQHILFDIYSFGTILGQMSEYLKESDLISKNQGINSLQIIKLIVAKCRQPDPIDRMTFDELLFYIKLLKDISSQQ